MPLKMGELFAGYGGLGMGVEQVLEVERAWVSEFDPAPSRILNHHWPDVPNLGDITKIDWAQVESVDILTGGFPCQDVSLAGARAGMKDGTRSGLWSEFARAIEALQPLLVVIENVRGLLSASAGKGHDVDLERCPVCLGDNPDDDLRALGAVLGDLFRLGFDAEWGMLEAAAVGAPHRRARVFIVAWPRVRYAGHDAGGSELGVEPEMAGGGLGQSSQELGGRLMPTPTANEHTGAGHSASKKGSPTLRTAASMLPTPSVADVQGGRKHRSGERSGELLLNGIAAKGRFGDYAVAVQRWERVIGRSAPDPTEPGPKSGQRLSPRFVEWMMGLPDGHVTDVEISRTGQLKALGNGVVPQQAAEAIRGLLARI